MGVSLNSTIVPGPLLSMDIRIILEVINYVILNQLISLFGVIANVINIIIFAKQGLQDAANTSLLTLAVGDTGILLTTFLTGTWVNPLVYSSDIHLDTREITFLTAGFPHVYFARVTHWIIAFITFERCICITMPLKVKTIFTPKTSVATMIVIHIFVLIAASPMLFTTRLGWKFYPGQNRSLIGLVFRYANMYMVSFSISSVTEAVNSSMNIFVYMRMSTRYKDTFDILFRRHKKASA